MSLFDDSTPTMSFSGGSREEVRARMMRTSMPDSPWLRPAFPSLKEAARIAVDIESHDPQLSEKGPGFIRGDAYVIGVAVAARMRDASVWSGYFPIRHDTDRDMNFEPEKVYRWLEEQMAGDQPKVAANALYDAEGTWVDSEKTIGRPVVWNGPIYDVQIAAPLLDEDAFSYSLENLSLQHLGVGKTESLLHKVAPLYGVALKNPDLIKDPERRAKAIAENEQAIKRNLRKFSPKYVGPYAEDDCRLALGVLDKQQPLLEAERSEYQGRRVDLWQVFQRESALIPLMLRMRLKGVPVDISAAEALRERLIADEAEMQRRLNAMAGMRVDVWKPQDLQRACEKNNVQYVKIEKTGNPSFTKDWLAAAGDKVPFIKLAGEIRKMSKQRRDFVEAMILESHVNGRIHAQFHSMKKDEEGTRSGRFSSSKPNLQQVTGRDKVYAPLIRGLFVAEAGRRWGAFDVKAQEPRWTVHYACLCGLEGAEEVADKYRGDPNTDYHQVVADLASISRKAAKEVNLGLAYGMGRRKLSWKLGFMSESQAMDPHGPPVPPEVDEILAKYHAGVPFVKPLMEACARQAEKNKCITTFWGRRRHFNLVERAGRRKNEDGSYENAMTLERFKEMYPRERWVVAQTHKALNSLIQGSSADHMKQMMLDVYAAGYTPNLTVHDELDFADIDSDKEFQEIHDAMRDAVRLVIPVVLDAKMGKNWAEAK